MNNAIETNHHRVVRKPTDCLVILHISDLHFGRDKTEQEEQNRKLVLGQLGKKILSLGEDWQPSYLCITGDIADSGATSEYNKARKWLQSFIQMLSIDINDVFICPGNHDVDQTICNTVSKSESDKEFDDIVSIPLPAHIEAPFANYIAFLEDLSIPKYHYKADLSMKSHLFGVRLTDRKIKFICCNSCFYSWNKNSKSRPMLGNALLHCMQSEELIETEPDHEVVTIAIVHHPKEQLDESEYFSWSHRPAAFNRLEEMSHLILTGHEHAKITPWNHSGYGAYFSCIGAVFFGVNHENSFQLFRINRSQNRYECKYFQWNPSQVKWMAVENLRNEWPFDKAIMELTRSITATDKESYDGKAYRIVCDLWNQIQGWDFMSAKELWKREKDWFAANRSEINSNLVEQIELCVKEIESRSE